MLQDRRVAPERPARDSALQVLDDAAGFDDGAAGADTVFRAASYIVTIFSMFLDAKWEGHARRPLWVYGHFVMHPEGRTVVPENNQGRLGKLHGWF